MTNPTVSAGKSFECIGCGKRFKKIKLDKKYHDKGCDYFDILLSENESNMIEKWFKEDHGIDPEIFKGIPKFIERRYINGTDIELLSALQIMRYVHDGIAR